MALKYIIPSFVLESGTNQNDYSAWLNRKAVAHAKRDKKREYEEVTGAKYTSAIHQAVQESYGLDYYTGEQLDWSLIKKYNNEASKLGRHAYKQRACFATYSRPY